MLVNNWKCICRSVTQFEVVLQPHRPTTHRLEVNVSQYFDTWLFCFVDNLSLIGFIDSDVWLSSNVMTQINTFDEFSSFSKLKEFDDWFLKDTFFVFLSYLSFAIFNLKNVPKRRKCSKVALGRGKEIKIQLGNWFGEVFSWQQCTKYVFLFVTILKFCW